MVVDTTVLCTLTDELVEQSILTLDEDAVVFEETDNGLEVVDKYQELWCRTYDILDNELNGEQ